MKTIKIIWQRLVSEGKTCPRCRTTGEELEKAISRLRESLNPLGIKVVLEKEELTIEQFQKDPLKSNMIIINQKSLEDWIGGSVGESQCCDVCGSSNCRTTNIQGETYETIPSEYIIKAGLLAATELMGNKSNVSCCDNKSSNQSCC